ncbi:hypothetical protein AAVH_02116 [Aphelenchoides avenae]|nr:hypothetical protein AAVH_02116 [Aphelenchus avenae]
MSKETLKMKLTRTFAPPANGKNNAELTRKIEELEVRLQLEKRRRQKVENENEELRLRIDIMTAKPDQSQPAQPTDGLLKLKVMKLRNEMRRAVGNMKSAMCDFEALIGNVDSLLQDGTGETSLNGTVRQQHSNPKFLPSLDRIAESPIAGSSSSGSIRKAKAAVTNEQPTNESFADVVGMPLQTSVLEHSNGPASPEQSLTQSFITSRSRSRSVVVTPPRLKNPSARDMGGSQPVFRFDDDESQMDDTAGSATPKASENTRLITSSGSANMSGNTTQGNITIKNAPANATDRDVSSESMSSISMISGFGMTPGNGGSSQRPKRSAASKISTFKEPALNKKLRRPK